MQILGTRGFFGALLLATSFSCGPADEVTIELTRTLGSDAAFAMAGASSAERFAGSSEEEDHTGHDHAAEEEEAPEVPFLYQVPEGWTELSPGGQRWINLQPASHPEASCYLTILGGDGGGLVANVNRWLDQLGLEPLGEAEVADLPKVMLLGQPATLVKGFGHFTGMGDQALDNWGLLGLIQTMRIPSPNDQEQVFTAFVKMTGPADLVEAEQLGFEAFYQSLVPRDTDEHTSNADHADHDKQAGAKKQPAIGNRPLTYETPSGWTDVGTSGMRLINLAVGTASECYVIRLASDGGGLADNVNRWREQLGLDPLDAKALAAMPEVDCLGTQAVFFDAAGAYSGMSGESLSSARMLGALVFLGSQSYFIKFVGPANEIDQQAEAFKAFLASLGWAS